MTLSFRTRLILFILLLLSLIQVLDLLSVWQSTRRAVIADSSVRLDYARNAFDEYIADLTDRLAEDARIATLDFSIREALALGDLPTRASVTRNIARRVEADRALLIDLDGTLLVDTARGMDGVAGERFPFPALVTASARTDRGAAIVVLDDTIYQLVLVPVKAPVAVAHVGVAVAIDREVANGLPAVGPLPLETAFAFGAADATEPAGSAAPSPPTWTVTATTWDHRDPAEIAAAIGALMDGGPSDGVPVDSPEGGIGIDGAETAGQTPAASTEAAGAETAGPRSPVAASAFIDIGGDRYVATASALATPPGSQPVRALLAYSVDAAIAQTRPLLLSMVALFAVSLVAASIGTVLLAQSISRPIRILTGAASRMQDGDYGQPVTLPRRDEFGVLADSFNQMMQAIRDREQRIARQARQDPLTRLPNRTEFAVRVDRLLADRSLPAVVAVVTLDRLQEINRTIGYDVGDRVLIAAAERLSAERAPDGEVARIGGDEFGLLLPVSADTGMATLAALLQAFEDQIQIDKVTLDVTVHGGLAVFPEDGRTATELLQRADSALAAAVDAKHPFHRFDAGRDAPRPERLSLMSELRRGIEAGDLHLHYQPKIDLAHDRITHVEALVRWTHPTRGRIFPDEFIPLAEQTGQIRRLSAWALETAVAQATAWRAAGVDLIVAVNLSSRDVIDRRLPRLVQEVLDRHGLPPGNLTLEITESALMQDPDAAVDTLVRLSEMGLTLSVDDYGTGYSSMSYLKRLPVHELKIDKSFVLNLATDTDDEVIVRSTVELGYNLGLKVVAEGVEDAESYAILKRFGCTMAQGYYIARPMDADALTRFATTPPWGTAQPAVPPPPQG